jgi:hypothetical protein
MQQLRGLAQELVAELNPVAQNNPKIPLCGNSRLPVSCGHGSAMAEPLERPG